MSLHRTAPLRQDTRIPEADIRKAALRALARNPAGCLSTREMIVLLRDDLAPQGLDAEALPCGNGTRFDQKVRNLVSNRDTAQSLTSKGYATYDRALSAWQITEAGRKAARSGLH